MINIKTKSWISISEVNIWKNHNWKKSIECNYLNTHTCPRKVILQWVEEVEKTSVEKYVDVEAKTNRTSFCAFFISSFSFCQAPFNMWLKNILPLFFIFNLSNGFYDFFWGPWNRTIPAWHHYKYHEIVNSSETVRHYVLQELQPRSFIMCPKGFVIRKFEVELLHEIKNSTEEGLENKKVKNLR